MIISTSNVGMESVRKFCSVRMDAYGTTLPISKTVPDETTVNDNNSRPKNALPSGDFRNAMDNLMKKFESMGTSRITHDHAEESAISRIKTECIIFLLRLLFGTETDDDVDTGSYRGSSFSPGHEEHYYGETEELSFKTTGKVITADGREIDFDLSFQASRSFEEYYSKDRLPDLSVLRDPLVINLDSPVANVSDQKFCFDIDSDGITDRISMPGKGSGFLALDRNNDGIINDGSELFGTKSGDGFKDLAAYDSDGNGWIDEADPVFKDLKIYSMNEDGTASVYGVAEKGVGAIYLGSVQTDYSLKNAFNNSLNAQIRRTGMFLYENGLSGTVQHLDVAS